MDDSNSPPVAPRVHRHVHAVPASVAPACLYLARRHAPPCCQASLCLPRHAWDEAERIPLITVRDPGGLRGVAGAERAANRIARIVAVRLQVRECVSGAAGDVCEEIVNTEPGLRMSTAPHRDILAAVLSRLLVIHCHTACER